MESWCKRLVKCTHIMWLKLGIKTENNRVALFVSLMLHFPEK